jgi:hypothetical protein
LLQDHIAEDISFKNDMFGWLENIISCELPYDEGSVSETSSMDIKKPVYSEGECDPRHE